MQVDRPGLGLAKKIILYPDRPGIGMSAAFIVADEAAVLGLDAGDAIHSRKRGRALEKAQGNQKFPDDE
jgi:hypothetical protein